MAGHKKNEIGSNSVELDNRKNLRDIDRELRKDLFIRTIFILAFLSSFVAFSVFVFREFFSEPPSISFVKGDVRIFVNGIWIPLRAGISYEQIKTAKLRIEKGEILIGENIKLSSEKYAEVEIRDEKIKVVEGEVKVGIRGTELKLGENQELNLSIASRKFSEEKHILVEEKKSEEIKVGEKKSEEIKERGDEKRMEEELGEMVSREVGKVGITAGEFPVELSDFSVSVSGFNAYIFIRASAKKIFVNGIPSYSETGDFNLVLPIVEGKNEILVQAEDTNGKIKFLGKRDIVIDYTPPRLEEQKIQWTF